MCSIFNFQSRYASTSLWPWKVGILRLFFLNPISLSSALSLSFISSLLSILLSLLSSYFHHYFHHEFLYSIVFSHFLHPHKFLIISTCTLILIVFMSSLSILSTNFFLSFFSSLTPPIITSLTLLNFHIQVLNLFLQVHNHASLWRMALRIITSIHWICHNEKEIY